MSTLSAPKPTQYQESKIPIHLGGKTVSGQGGGTILSGSGTAPSSSTTFGGKKLLLGN